MCKKHMQNLAFLVNSIVITTLYQHVQDVYTTSPLVNVL